jgi:hypothetical protein
LNKLIANIKSVKMSRINFLVCLLAFVVGVNAQKHHTIFVEAESFTTPGGWVIDQQFMDEMGSPYLMAHGLGISVDDAVTMVDFPKTGNYYLFVRTKNWAARWSKQEAPGRFQVLVNNQLLTKTFGAENTNWAWSEGGMVEISSKKTSIALHDLTGFNGRCDALIFTTDPDFIPVNTDPELTLFRQKMLHLRNRPQSAGMYDLVVVGGGMGGICTAISAARLGVKVALIQNRPVLGGNNSSEVRVHLGARIRQEPWPNLGNLVNEIGPSRGGNAQPEDYYEDDKKLQAVLAEKNISLFLNWHANGVQMKENKIVAVEARNIISGEKLVFKAPLFADCTGDGTIGVLAGADYMTGRESRSTFGEPTAPERADSLTMGASVQWYSDKQDAPVSFPDIKWGIKLNESCLLYTSPSPRDRQKSRMPSSA